MDYYNDYIKMKSKYLKLKQKINGGSTSISSVELLTNTPIQTPNIIKTPTVIPEKSSINSSIKKDPRDCKCVYKTTCFNCSSKKNLSCITCKTSCVCYNKGTIVNK